MKDRKLNNATAIYFAVHEAPREIPAELVHYEDTGIEPSLSWLYETLGCSSVECVRLPDGDLWIDDSGKLQPEAYVNAYATALCDDVLGAGDFIAGPAVFVARNNAPVRTEFAKEGEQ